MQPRTSLLHCMADWHIAARTCATARPQLAKADTAFQAQPLVNRLNLD